MCAVLEDVASIVFLHEFMAANTPCLLKGGGLQVPVDWVGSRGIDWTRMTQIFGDVEVPVENYSGHGYTERQRQTMLLSDYVKAYERGEPLYLKDWHFFRDFPAYDGFTKPVYFWFDWLNEYWDQKSDRTDDYRFVYFGPAGSSTTFHVDVLRSYSWSVNVHGCKEWVLVPPGQEVGVKDKHGGFSPMTNAELLQKIPAAMRVVQRTNEALFVPSGWHHQVVNLEDTLSINNNWINGWNVHHVCRFLKDELLQVQKEIQDLKSMMDNWTSHCQVLLKANCGMDYFDFCQMLLTIGLPRFQCYEKLKDNGIPSSSSDLAAEKSGKYSLSSYCAGLKNFCSYRQSTSLRKEDAQGLKTPSNSHVDHSPMDSMLRICSNELVALHSCLLDISQSAEFKECAPPYLAQEVLSFLHAIDKVGLPPV